MPFSLALQPVGGQLEYLCRKGFQLRNFWRKNRGRPNAWHAGKNMIWLICKI